MARAEFQQLQLQEDVSGPARGRSRFQLLFPAPRIRAAGRSLQQIQQTCTRPRVTGLLTSSSHSSSSSRSSRSLPLLATPSLPAQDNRWLGWPDLEKSGCFRQTRCSGPGWSPSSQTRRGRSSWLPSWQKVGMKVLRGSVSLRARIILPKFNLYF